MLASRCLFSVVPTAARAALDRHVAHTATSIVRTFQQRAISTAPPGMLPVWRCLACNAYASYNMSYIFSNVDNSRQRARYAGMAALLCAPWLRRHAYSRLLTQLRMVARDHINAFDSTTNAAPTRVVPPSATGGGELTRA